MALKIEILEICKIYAKIRDLEYLANNIILSGNRAKLKRELENLDFLIKDNPDFLNILNLDYGLRRDIKQRLNTVNTVEDLPIRYLLSNLNELLT